MTKSPLKRKASDSDGEGVTDTSAATKSPLKRQDLDSDGEGVTDTAVASKSPLGSAGDKATLPTSTLINTTKKPP
jgi:hypothetical protein